MNIIKKIFSKNKKQLFVEYEELNNSIMQIVEDIKSLREDTINDISKELKALEKAKKSLEKELINIEEHFYDVKKGMWIGIARDLEDESLEPLLLYLPWKNLHNHLEVFGTSGYGKSRLMAIMVRQMIKFNWSTMIIDPKGGAKQEIPQWTYDFAAEAGRNEQVMRIMPTYPELSDKGNILFGLSNDEIASMCASLTVSGSGAASSDEQFFSGQVYRTTLGILSAVTYLEKAAYPNKKDINSKIREEVEKYIRFKEYGNKEFKEHGENLCYPDPVRISLKEVVSDTDIKYMISPFNRTLVTFRELSYFANFDRLTELKELVEDYPIPIDITREYEAELRELKQNALRVLEDITSMEKAFFEKTGTSLSVLLSQLAYGPVGSILCDIRINPLVQKIRDDEGVIIILQPAPMRFEKVSEMLMKCYTKMFLSLFGTIGASGRGINKRVGFVIDEAKPMMFPGIEELYNKARQLGMSIFAFFQSTSDRKLALGEILADIVQDNTGTSIFMKQVSRISREEVAASFGVTKVAVNVFMQDNTEINAGKSTVVFEDRDIVAPEDLDSLGIGEAFIKHYGKMYHCVFPYQRDPMDINVTMPKLEAELVYEEIERIENGLRQSVNNIDRYNTNEKALKDKEKGDNEQIAS